MTNTEPSKRERPFCKACGSYNVVKDAWSEWDDDTQEWVLRTTFDHMQCDDCCGDSIGWHASPADLTPTNEE
jgi:hypothetical protein